jgi:hypothetical protein
MAKLYYMKNILVLLFFIVVAENSFCQGVIINGVNKNRPLTWDDFTGTPDKNSSFEANTYWKLNYKFDGIDFKGDTVKLNSFSVGIELDPNKSWVKKGKETADLLNHEQGHFTIGLLCQNDIIRQIRTTIFFKSNFSEKIKEVFTELSKKYDLMSLKYDEETDHSKNKVNQKKWDTFFSEELNKFGIIF